MAEADEDRKPAEYICTTHLHQESTTVDWVIQNFDLLLSLKNIQLDSSFFWSNKPSGSYRNGDPGDWRLRLSDNDTRDILALYIFYRDYGNVSVNFKASIVDENGEETDAGEVEGRMKSCYMGIENFAKKSEMDDYLLEDGSLTIRCNITVTFMNRGTTERLQFPKSGNQDVNRLSQDISSLLQDNLLSDVHLLSGDQKFQAHKNILSARSSVFRAMFQHGMKESKENVVKIEDLDSNIFSAMLSYMYSGRANISGVHMAIKLFQAADKYCMEELKTICEKFLKENISFVNVIQVAEVAVFYGLQQLQEACVGYICTHKRELLFSNNLQPQFFSKIPPSLFESIMKTLLKNDQNIRKPQATRAAP